MGTAVAIAAGGALGALARHAVASVLAGALGTPGAILMVNVAGSLAIGFLAGAFAQFLAAPAELRAFLTTGFLGGFTTYSAYALDTVLLIERGAPGLATLYAAGTAVLSILACVAGLALARALA